MPLPITGNRGFTYAEVTAGGVRSLRAAPGDDGIAPLSRTLFVRPEICDVDGRIGGYNFQWAWSVVTSSALRSDNLFMHFSAALVMLIARLFIQEDAMSTSSEVVKSRSNRRSQPRTALQQTDDLIVARLSGCCIARDERSSRATTIRHLPDAVQR